MLRMFDDRIELFLVFVRETLLVSLEGFSDHLFSKGMPKSNDKDVSFQADCGALAALWR